MKEEKVGKGKWEKGGKPSWKANRERIQVACYLFGEAYKKVKIKEKRRNLRGQNDRERNERKKCSVQTDMKKGIKGRSACQSRHNLGHCKKTAIWLTTRKNTPEKSKKRKRSEWRKSVDDKTKERKQ